MFTFHWGVEYVLSLTYPAFMELSGLVGRVRADSAIDVDYSAYCAGKYGKEAAESLFEARGSFRLGGNPPKGAPKGRPAYTDEELEAARRRALRRLQAMGAVAEGAC